MNPPPTESHGLIVTRIEALGFRSLRYVSQRLGSFHVLVGPNAEVALPLDAINADSVREKSIRHGHPSTLHAPIGVAQANVRAALPHLLETQASQNRDDFTVFEHRHGRPSTHGHAPARQLDKHNRARRPGCSA